MNNIITYCYKSKLGNLIIGDYEGKLCLCDWQYRSKRNEIDSRISSYLNASYREGITPLIELTILQLEEYFLQNRNLFSIPLLLAGTAFQKKVWLELQKIPYGATIAYLDLAKQFGDVNAIRAIASANGANAISIIVPCHRVIGKNGSLVGYAGGLATKSALLEIERRGSIQLALEI